MKARVQEKAMAIQLRRQGLSYKDILAVVPVAKSSLSLWLKDLPLTKDEKKSLRKRKKANISRGRIKAATANHLNRLEKEKNQIPSIRSEFEQYSAEPLFQLGIGLYWAEGAKSSGGVMFINSDEHMIETMLVWFQKYANISRSELRYRLYIHKVFMDGGYEAWWAKKINVPLSRFARTTYKPSNRGVKKQQKYKGCLRVEVPKSSVLLFKLKVWTQLVVEYNCKR